MNNNIPCAYSIKTSRVKEPDFPYYGTALTCSGDVIKFVKDLQNADIEKMVVLYMDAQNKIISIQVCKGTVNQAAIYPREILRHALLLGVSSIILTHNHPSGNTSPSEADIHLTRTLKTGAAIFDMQILDHIIIGESSYCSFKEDGII